MAAAGWRDEFKERARARGRHGSEGWRQRSKEREGENNFFFYGFVRTELVGNLKGSKIGKRMSEGMCLLY